MEMTTANDVMRARRDGTVLGIPLGELGWFQTLLISASTAFAVFFATTFLAIVSMIVYVIATGKHVDYSMAYKRAGLPAGLLALVIALGVLGSMWAKRKLRSS